MSKPHVYATLFDKNYLAKGICLIRSMGRHYGDNPWILYVLALDKRTEYFLKDLNAKIGGMLVVKTLEEVTTPELLVAQSNRDHKEFCWTLGSYFTHWVFKDAGVQETIYLDSDLYFFDDPQIVLKELGSKAVGIIPHRLIPEKKHLEVNGIYNVGWVGFRGDRGLKILEKWRNQCLEWCYNRVEPNRFADQKYLDEWPSYGCCTCVIKNIGAGLAPWNLAQYQLEERGGKLFAYGFPVVFYHYHEFFEKPNGEFQLTNYHLRPGDVEKIYV